MDTIGRLSKGSVLLTRLTKRTAVVQDHDLVLGVRVFWSEGKVGYLHPDIVVDQVEGVFKREGE